MTGQGKYAGRKGFQWTIVQGKAKIENASYKDGKIMISGTYPYVTGYVDIRIINRNGETVAQKKINGTKHSGDKMSVTMKKGLPPGKYKVKVKAVSYTTHGMSGTHEITKEGVATAVKELPVKGTDYDLFERRTNANRR